VGDGGGGSPGLGGVLKAQFAADGLIGLEAPEALLLCGAPPAQGSRAQRTIRWRRTPRGRGARWRGGGEGAGKGKQDEKGSTSQTGSART